MWNLTETRLQSFMATLTECDCVQVCVCAGVCIYIVALLEHYWGFAFIFVVSMVASIVILHVFKKNKNTAWKYFWQKARVHFVQHLICVSILCVRHAGQPRICWRQQHIFLSATAPQGYHVLQHHHCGTYFINIRNSRWLILTLNPTTVQTPTVIVFQQKQLEPINVPLETPRILYQFIRVCILSISSIILQRMLLIMFAQIFANIHYVYIHVFILMISMCSFLIVIGPERRLMTPLLFYQST